MAQLYRNIDGHTLAKLLAGKHPPPDWNTVARDYAARLVAAAAHAANVERQPPMNLHQLCELAFKAGCQHVAKGYVPGVAATRAAVKRKSAS